MFINYEITEMRALISGIVRLHNWFNALFMESSEKKSKRDNTIKYHIPLLLNKKYDSGFFYWKRYEFWS